MIDARPSIALALAGSGGAGVMTVGAILLEAAARAGYYGLLIRRFGPQVRGGESAALLQLATEPIDAPPDSYDALIAVDWRHFEQFTEEIPLGAHSVIVGDPKRGEPPAELRMRSRRVFDAHFADVASEHLDARANVVALGVAASIAGLPEDLVRTELERKLHGHGPAASGPIRAFEIGYRYGESLGVQLQLDPPGVRDTRWLMSGNEAMALGALRGGVRFVSSYPITPATDLAQWIEPRIAQLGGTFVQAEDELAAMNMVLGASFGGTPAMTVTSGPGLSLMVESLGLASAVELPALIVDVQRVGPSTGIPTKSEQADLNLAVYGAHGEAPRIVLAPTSIRDAVPTTHWAVELAESLQTPVVLLSDQQLAHSVAIVDRVAEDVRDPAAKRLTANEHTRRYAATASGVSPMALPGTEWAGWVAEGLTHGEAGEPSIAARDHLAQLDKRARKLLQHDYGPRWADCAGDGDAAVITWGSAAGATREAVARMHADSANLRFIALRLLAPVQTGKLLQALRGVRSVLVVEQNHSGQLFRLLRAFGDFPFSLASFARPGPLPLRPGEVEEAIIKWGHSQ